jgi:hypothetical protein
VLTVQLACTPPILNEVLGFVLGGVPDIAIVSSSSAGADVILVSTHDGVDNPLDWVKAARSGRYVVALDSHNNVLWVRRRGKDATGERITAGTATKLVDVLQELKHLARTAATADRVKFGA